MLLVRSFPQDGATGGYFFVVMTATVLNSFTRYDSLEPVACAIYIDAVYSTVQFVGMGSFFTKISDPLIGGTYMTLVGLAYIHDLRASRSEG